MTVGDHPGKGLAAAESSRVSVRACRPIVDFWSACQLSASLDALGFVRSVYDGPLRADSRAWQVARRLQSVPYATERKTLLRNTIKPFPDGG